MERRKEKERKGEEGWKEKEELFRSKKGK